ncbi:MAG TPA: sulfatase [Planctomycetaceae bacterium]|nr:sulfatase [Planctomycetaceae bacterium]
MSPAITHPLQPRRAFLQQTACGLGGIALSQLLSADAVAERSPVGVEETHTPPRAKRVIFIFMSGAPSQYDLFLPRPELQRLHRQPVPASFLKGLQDPLIKGSAQVFASPRKFRRYGESGMEFSDYLPHLAQHADDLCMVRSMHTDIANHHPAQLVMNCGVPLFGHPSMGSWVTYGLGSEADNLPGFVVLLSNSGEGVDGGSSLWNNGFLPSQFRGVNFRGTGEPILHLSNPKGITQRTQRLRMQALQRLNRIRLGETADDEVAARIDSYELAFRMQTAAPELVDFFTETQQTRQLYGLVNDTTRWFGGNCLLARRMVERGVRFVQLYHSTWDDHSNLNAKLKTNCDMTDLPAAGLLQDLKQRGLLDDTLVIWGGEFGRTPMNEVRRGNTPGKEGRDHHPFCFTMLLAGGGVQRGTIVGDADELGYHPTEVPVHVHDLQATLLHCLGIDHEQLTFRHQGRDFRLTDVGGQVIPQLLS